MRILVVDDSDRLRTALASGLRQANHVVDCAANGQEALDLLQNFSFDVMVLDIVMPKVDGIGVLQEIRKRQTPIRVLVLSARDQVNDRVSLLDLGADDYLVKPFSFDELRARVEALGRRGQRESAPSISIGGVQIDLAAKLARANEQPLPLTPKEYALLELLMRRRGQVLSRQQIFDQLYDSQSESSDRVVEVLMSTLRGKLESAGISDLVQTRRGFGYVVE